MPGSLSDSAFRAVVQEAPDAIILVDSEGRIIFANAQVRELFDYVPEDLVGQRIEILVPESRRSMHVIHREIYQEHPTRRSMGVGLDLTGRRKNGSTFPVEISLSSFMDGDSVLSVAAVRDVTRQRRAEEALRRSEERHRLLNERSESLVFRYHLGPTPGFDYISSFVGRSLGYSPEEFYVDDQLIFAITEVEDRDQLRAVLSDSPQPAVVRLMSRAGETYWFDWRVVPVSGPDGTLIALEGTARDITARRLADAERADLEAQVELETERRRIAGDLHDDTIQSVYALGLGLHAARDDDAISKENAIDRTIEGLEAIITALRAYMQQLSGADEPTVTSTLATRIHALIDRSMPTRWIVEVDPSLLLDPAVDRQIYLLAKELISNVHRHARAKSATVSFRRNEAGVLTLEVTDDGVGFERQHLAAGSFGLRSVELRAGTVGATLEIDSSEGRGTSVRVTFPATT